MIVEQLVEWRLAGKLKYLEKTCPSATLSTTNPTRTDPGSNPGRRRGKSATNRLSYGAASRTQLNVTFLNFHVHVNIEALSHFKSDIIFVF
jgi:hypothetical protein